MAGLIEKMAKDAKISKCGCRKSIKIIYRRSDQIEKTKQQGNFGWLRTFRNFHSKTLKGRDSPIGEAIKIKEKKFVKFKPDKSLIKSKLLLFIKIF